MIDLPILKIKKVKEWVKKNKSVATIEPNIVSSCLLSENDEIIGFYLKWDDVPERVRKLWTMINNELLSKRVPKSIMSRVAYDKKWNEIILKQFSAIIWWTKPSPFKQRYIPWLAHLHLVTSAEKYIKLKYLFAKECEQMIRELTPHLYTRQKELLKNQKIKIGNLWTSWIDNFNWSVNTHMDWWNIKGANNIIYFKRKNSIWWNLHIPEYWGVVDSANDSLVFYPAYKHIHWVDAIVPLKEWGYRNSIVLYPLNIKYD